MAGSLVTGHTGLPADWDVAASAGHSHVYSLVILGVLREVSLRNAALELGFVTAEERSHEDDQALCRRRLIRPQYLTGRNFKRTTTMSDNSESGYALLHDPHLNKGTAFTEFERKAKGLEGLLPTVPNTLEQQTARIHVELSYLDNDLQKYLFLSDLQARNETLFYAVVMSDPATFMPIVPPRSPPAAGSVAREHCGRSQVFGAETESMGWWPGWVPAWDGGTSWHCVLSMFSHHLPPAAAVRFART